VPDYWPGGVRRKGITSPGCGFHTELGKAGLDTPGEPARVGERERVKRQIREALSTVAWPAGGPTRSSAEAPVTGVERRGRLIWMDSFGQPEIWEGSGGDIKAEGEVF
jgi:hypothetical protein